MSDFELLSGAAQGHKKVTAPGQGKSGYSFYEEVIP